MKDLFHRFGSLRITVAILTALLLALSAGTIVESMHGSALAGRFVYHAAWFRALLGVFAVNLACSIASLWPFGRRRVGYVLTHASMLVILGGALATDLAKTEGQLQILEGEESNAVLGPPGPDGAPSAVATLPFALRLEAFEIDYYEGTRMPAQYRSRLAVVEGGATRPAVIEMNRPLEHGGWHFFQSSYREGRERDLTILSVSKDPGEPIAFAGYYGLVLGMIVVLGTRIAERRRASRLAVAAAVLAAAALGARAGAAQTPPTASADDVSVLKTLPVQHDGRVMPLDTLAREAVFKVTGRRSVWGLDPVATVLGWTLDPRAWSVQPIVPLDRRLAQAIGAPGVQWSSFQALAANGSLHELIAAAQEAEANERPLRPVEKSAQKLEGRLVWMQRFFDQDVLRVVPDDTPGGTWSAPAHLHSAADLRALAGSGAAAARLSRRDADREIAYNTARPTRTAWIVLALSLVLSIAAWNTGRRGFDVAAGGTLLAGFAVMTWGIGVRWAIAGRIPAANMYESLLFLAWGTGAFAVLAMLVMRNRIVILNAAAISALTMALTDLLPIDPFIHPVPPVLAGTYWLAVHVPIIMVGYAVLALGMLVAHMQAGFQAFAPERRSAALAFEQLLYWYTHVGSILLVAGILTGSMWAAESWGRYWGWDPKEVWSLVAFLAYMAILHARAERLIGSFGVAAWSIAAFQTILMTYIGVNFVLSAGLHSYGFGESNVVLWMAIVAAAEAAFIAAAWWRVHARDTASAA